MTQERWQPKVGEEVKCIRNVVSAGKPFDAFSYMKVEDTLIVKSIGKNASLGKMVDCVIYQTNAGDNYLPIVDVKPIDFILPKEGDIITLINGQKIRVHCITDNQKDPNGLAIAGYTENGGLYSGYLADIKITSSNIEIDECICDSWNLHAFGCKCGYFAREMLAKKKG